ncbi:hypothetical protein K9U39_19125 [Rhodoblastus acidophilus]|nr:hypothetical protein [Rhodoblastus acidophilus]
MIAVHFLLGATGTPSCGTRAAVRDFMSAGDAGADFALAGVVIGVLTENDPHAA